MNRYCGQYSKSLMVSSFVLVKNFVINSFITSRVNVAYTTSTFSGKKILSSYLKYISLVISEVELLKYVD